MVINKDNIELTANRVRCVTNSKIILDKSLHQKTELALKSYGSHTAGTLMEFSPNLTTILIFILISPVTCEAGINFSKPSII